MPITTTTRGPDGPRRRRVLAGSAAALIGLSGCSGGSPGPGDDSAERAPAGRRLREAAGRDTLALLARYDATAGAHPALAARLRPLRDQVALHAGAFAASPQPSPAADGVPGDEKAALAALADAERRAGDARTAALDAAPPELARLLASVAAACAAHAFLLRGTA
ncbi:hypothetical protein ACFP1Z_13010 [Streptomyces gamaensis]|uniref:Lipoprotein n=1 Tax=Streptomyces gamaensis TaxID=1763542 RepID=A0ABW0Z233_9ACTN